jgi:hypothetical protein
MSLKLGILKDVSPTHSHILANPGFSKPAKILIQNVHYITHIERITESKACLMCLNRKADIPSFNCSDPMPRKLGLRVL